MIWKIELTNFLVLLGLIFSIASCSTNRAVTQMSSNKTGELIQNFKSEGGSSGMEQIGDQSYLVVYDLKAHKQGIRMGLIKVSDESLTVSPIEIASWDLEGVPNDLESICAVPGKTDEFLVAEAGNWQGKLGRIFHVKVDIKNHTASVLGSVRLPFLHRNDLDTTGDQYEAMICLPYDETSRVVLLGERGGSRVNPNGIVRWGILNIIEHTFIISDVGLKGTHVNVPGDWKNNQTKRDITDFHMDDDGGLWAAASEDQGETGPFYSVIYKLGQTNPMNKEKPFTVYKTIDISKEVSGFKIEALSGPCKGIDTSHTFGTEDEIYGGVWRPINIE